MDVSPKYSEWSATQKTNTNPELSGTNVIYVLSFPAFQLVERLYDPGTEHPPPLIYIPHRILEYKSWSQPCLPKFYFQKWLMSKTPREEYWDGHCMLRVTGITSQMNQEASQSVTVFNTEIWSLKVAVRWLVLGFRGKGGLKGHLNFVIWWDNEIKLWGRFPNVPIFVSVHANIKDWSFQSFILELRGLYFRKHLQQQKIQFSG